MFERNDHAVVVGQCIRAVFRDLAEARICAGRYRRTGALRRRERAESEGIRVWIANQFMNPVMAEVTDADRRVRSESLLPFEAPPLKLRRMNVLFRGTNGGWRKIGIYRLDLSERFAGSEAVYKC